MRFTDPEFIVHGIIPAGLSILAGKPKSGKSWLALALAAGVASGGIALGSPQYQCKQGAVLYLALEDTDRRMQSRLQKIMAGASFPEGLLYATEWPRLDKGGLELLRERMEFDSPRLVIIDTLAKIRPAERRGENSYERDYEHVAALKSLADAHGTALIVVHHTRKMASDDVFDGVSGTLGITGAADATLILKRGQGACDAILHATGRDIEESETALSFQKETCTWRILGEPGQAKEYTRGRERQTILELLRKANGPMTAGDISAALGMSDNNVRQLLFKMRVIGEIKKSSRGQYIPAIDL